MERFGWWPRSVLGFGSPACCAVSNDWHLRFGIRPRRSFSMSAGLTYVTCKRFLGTIAWQQPRVTLTSIPSGFAHWSKTSG
jgi:hypothetical protein